ncbi:MAG: hypothetical protein Q4E75_01275 [bacterium]|nr:hypothetical protein [bacterium]
MEEIILYIITFVLIYLFYVVFVLSRKNVLKKFPDGKEITYLKYKYNVKVNDSNLKSIANSVFLANSFILSTTVFVVTRFKNIFLELIFGIITLVVLLLVIYHIIGKYLNKKQGGKHV